MHSSLHHTTPTAQGVEELANSSAKKKATLLASHANLFGPLIRLMHLKPKRNPIRIHNRVWSREP